MSEILGRDRLGRLVYEGDLLLNNAGVGMRVWYPSTDDEREFISYCVQFDVVDLERSPKRNNYERYFADLGTMYEIWDTGVELYVSGDDAMKSLYLAFSPMIFTTWLEEEATV